METPLNQNENYSRENGQSFRKKIKTGFLWVHFLKANTCELQKHFFFHISAEDF